MNKMMPLVTCGELAEVRSFYTDGLGWEVTLEMDTYLQVRHGSDDGDPELAFTAPTDADPDGVPMPAFTGAGLLVSVPVASPDDHRATVVASGLTPQTETTDKPWGWRSYVIVDPAGVRLDFYRPLGEAVA